MIHSYKIDAIAYKMYILRIVLIALPVLKIDYVEYKADLIVQG